MRIVRWFAFLIPVLALAAPLPAAAWDHGHWGDHDGWRGDHDWHGDRDWGDHDGGHFFLGLNFGAPLYTPYYDYPPPPAVVYQPPPAVIYQPPPVIVSPPPAPAAPPPPLAYAPPPTAARTVPPGCREFDSTVTIGGRAQKAWGIACRQPDGSWKIIK